MSASTSRRVGSVSLEISLQSRYDPENGRSEGAIEGNTVRGRWVQDNTQGGFTFRLSPDGRWGRSASETDGGPWSGRRSGGTKFSAGRGWPSSV